MDFNKNYLHLNKENRYLIEQLIKQKVSIRKIAAFIGCSPSTISREIKRNSSPDGQYRFEDADKKSSYRRIIKTFFKFIEPDFKYKEFTQLFLNKYNKNTYGIYATYHWIINNLKIKAPSVRTVFNWINTYRWAITKRQRLHSYYKKGGKRMVNVVSRLVPQEYVLPFWARPKYINNRSEYGHWEADLVIGKKSSGYDNLLTFTERKTRFSLIARVKSKQPDKINSILLNLIRKNNLEVRSITFDNGIEFEKVGLLAKWLKIKVYKADPYASFQRGSNENFNGLIRRKYKKGTDFTLISDEELNQYVAEINNMPRRILNWSSSLNLLLENNFV